MFQEMTLRRAVELAVKTEQVGYGYYDMMARKFSATEEVAAIFAQLAKDERGHEARFAKLLDGIPEDHAAADPDAETYLRALAYSTLLDKQAFTGAEAVTTPAAALARALEFEKSTLSYYEAIRTALGQNPEIDAIVTEERRHITSLFRVVMTDAKFRTTEDGW